MSKQPSNQSQKAEEEVWDDEEYSDLELLELLESVREDMEELGVTTLAEVIARIDDLHQRLDAK